MSNLYNDMILENIFDEVSGIPRYELIDELLETTVWRSVDPEKIPEVDMPYDGLVELVVRKRFELLGD